MTERDQTSNENQVAPEVVIETVYTEPVKPTIIQTEQAQPRVERAEMPVSLVQADQSTGMPDMSKFTPAQIETFKKRGDVLKKNDPTSILNFGADAQNKISATSNAFLNNVRAFDAGEVGTSITDLLTEINYIDIDPSSQPVWKRALMQIPGLKNIIMNTKKIFQKYDTVSSNIEGIVDKLELGRVTITKDNVQLEALFNQNIQQIHELDELMVIGHLKKQEIDNEIKSMRLTQGQYEEYEISDMEAFSNRLGKRLHDMALTRMITIQSLPQIRLVQENNFVMSEKIQQSIQTTIPIWKQQLSIAVALMRQQQNLKVQQQMYDTTNKILAKNAEMLKSNSIDVAKQNERGVVDIATLQKVQSDLISTLEEIKSIKAQGESARRDVDKALVQLETEVTNTVLTVNTSTSGKSLR